MKEEPTPTPQVENESESRRLDETEMANLTLNLQKIEGYEPATIESSQPVVAPPTAASQPIVGQAPRKKSGKKKWIIGGVIATFVLALGVGGWATYALWYQNPDKVITDALYNSMLAKTATTDGSVSFSSSDGASTIVKVQAQGGYKEGTTGTADVTFTYPDHTVFKLGVDGTQTSGGDYYFRLSSLQNAYKTYLDQTTKGEKKDGFSDAEIKQTVDAINGLIKPFIDKLDNQWVRFAMTDIKKYDKTLADEYECENKVIMKVANDDKKTQLMEIAKLYQKHKVIVYERSLGTKDGNMGLLVHIDQHELDQLGKEFKDTQFAKDLKACVKVESSSTDSSTVDDIVPKVDFSRLELWVDQWNHTLKRVYTKLDVGSDDTKMSYAADFNFKQDVPVTVSTPSGSKSIDELFPDLAKTLQGLQLGSNTDQTQPGDSSFSSSKDLTQRGNI